MKQHNLVAVIEEKTVIQGVPAYVYKAQCDTRAGIVFYHGLGSCAQKNRFRAGILASHGFHVVLPEALHHGERGAVDFDDVRNVGLYVYAVINQNVREFPAMRAKLAELGAGRVMTMGHSMGGFTSASVFSAYTDVDACCNLNGTFHFAKAAQKMNELSDEDRRYIEEHGTKPEWMPEEHLDRLKDRPILSIGGEADRVIPIEWQWEFNAMLEPLYTKKENFRQINIPFLGHFLTTNMMEEAVAWARNHLEDRL